MTKVLGVDVGTVRVGLAVSDPGRIVASPLDTLDAGADPQQTGGRVADRARQEECQTVVIGLPKGMSGRDTASTRLAREVADAVSQTGLHVRLWDERLSSAEAERMMIGAARGRAERRSARDRVAAAIILQGWLDSRQDVST